MFARADIMTKVTENTVKDLQYLGQYVFSGANNLTPGKQAKILSEYSTTFPRSAIDLDTICPDVAPLNVVPLIVKTFWPTLIGTGIEIPPCQDRNVLAVADFRGISNHDERKKLFLKTGNPLSPIANQYGTTANGIEIHNVGDYLEFDKGAL